ncbi:MULTISPECIES: hypothetical protein [Burkholderia]|uniref:Uncharacterized protein n=1 Tax=Burkholderia glumae TaxID=337 RepID=A0AAP9Y294_BURGL|nr:MULTISPECIES: hypothetical protein [Burkholderia]AJY65682.1 hypothetical protein KS03_2955 [Burkholderia glumae LMG 2196 = ATCC 33617]MBU9422485.1 hypothetical protein [Burkholderia gladioli]MDN8060143.1 hypothetical protein [Burkholderia gladioli]PNL01261.1 hypothetical protein CEQ24_019785 [Burkholderia glumae]QPQ85089.1 hypothetical protein I6H08_08850 [Burkholderia gladioli]
MNDQLIEARKLIAHASEYAISALGNDWHERATALLARPAPAISESPEAHDEATPAWMTCESRRPFVVNSLRSRAEDLRAAEKRCRNAYRKDFMGSPACYLADAYGEAATALEARLAAIDSVLGGGSRADR